METFRVVEEVTVDYVRWLILEDGNGWICVEKPGVGVMCERMAPDPGEVLRGMASAEPRVRVPPPGINPATVAEDVGRIQALQEEKEARARAEAEQAALMEDVTEGTDVRAGHSGAVLLSDGAAPEEAGSPSGEAHSEWIDRSFPFECLLAHV